jgi:hypothetical protein
MIVRSHFCWIWQPAGLQVQLIESKTSTVIDTSYIRTLALYMNYLNYIISSCNLNFHVIANDVWFSRENLVVKWSCIHCCFQSIQYVVLSDSMWYVLYGICNLERSMAWQCLTYAKKDNTLPTNTILGVHTCVNENKYFPDIFFTILNTLEPPFNGSLI